MPFNPLDYQRYARALPSSQRSAVTSATISVVNYLADIEADLERARRREEEYRYITSYGDRYDDLRRAWAEEARIEGYKGQPDCRRGSYYD